jgi:hypothetical protein
MSLSGASISSQTVPPIGTPITLQRFPSPVDH